MGLTLRRYQQEILDSLAHLPAIGLFMGTGSGKTITSLERTQYNPTEKTLIVCPCSVTSQWEDVITKHYPKMKVLQFKKSWSAERKNQEISTKENYNTIIVNFEIIPKLSSLLKIVDDTWTIIIDESHRIKNTKVTPRKDKSKGKMTRAEFAVELGKLTPFKIILTATPTQGLYGGYIDYYMQLKFLGYLHDSLDEFEARHVKTIQMKLPGKPYPINKIVGYKRTDRLDNILSTCCVRYIPKYGDYEASHIKISLEKPTNYDNLLKTRLYKDIVLKNISRKRIGLKTLCTGVISGQDYYGKNFRYQDNTIKQDWLKEFLEDTDEVVAIYYNYNVELEQLEKLMKALGKPYVVINGNTKDKYREINQKDFKVMLGQFQAASESIDGLQHKCHILVYFSLPESSTLYRQSLGRIDRDGQKFAPVYYYLLCKGTVEEDIYEMIENKIEFSEEVLNQLVYVEGDEKE